MHKTFRLAKKYGVEPLYIAELIASGFCPADIERLAKKRAAEIKETKEAKNVIY